MNWSFRGWWRVGVVLTVLWIAAAPYYVHYVEGPVVSDRLMAFSFHIADDYSLCVNRDHSDKAQCERAAKDGWAQESQRARQADGEALRHLGLYAVAPLPVFWLFGYGLLVVSRWVRSGFRLQVSDEVARAPEKSIWTIRGWWRVGLVLSVLWLAAVPLHFVLAVQPASAALVASQTAFIDTEYGDCKHNKNWSPRAQPLCLRLRDIGRTSLDRMKSDLAGHDRTDLLRHMFLWLLEGWALGYLLLITGRWLRSGFRKPEVVQLLAS